MNPHREEIRRLMIAVNVIDGIYESIARKMGMKDNTMALLYALDDGKPHSQKEICKKWLIPKTTLNTIVRECNQKEWTFLSGHSGKKEKEICLTPQGKAYAREALARIYRIEEQAMEQTLRRTTPEFVQDLELFAQHLHEEARTLPDEPKSDI
jgi:DNA-binding MarR family transcriptional regulator